MGRHLISIVLLAVGLCRSVDAGTFLQSASDAAPHFEVTVKPAAERWTLGEDPELKVTIVYTGAEPFFNRALLREEEFGLICLTQNLIDYPMREGSYPVRQRENAEARARGSYTASRPFRPITPEVLTVYMADGITSGTVIQQQRELSRIKQTMETREDKLLPTDHWMKTYDYFAGRRELSLNLSSFLMPEQPGTYHFILVLYLNERYDLNRPVPVVSNPFTIRFDPLE